MRVEVTSVRHFFVETGFRLITLFGLIAVASLSADERSAASQVPAPVSAPDKLLLVKLHAEGVQIYECKEDLSGGNSWQFREPLATLLENGKTVGRHFAGPTWELNSGGTVVGKVLAQARGRTSRDIALLKLAVIARRGEGDLTRSTIVQRLDTHGGAFGGPCRQAGSFHLEPYSADYVFLHG